VFYSTYSSDGGIISDVPADAGASTFMVSTVAYAEAIAVDTLNDLVVWSSRAQSPNTAATIWASHRDGGAAHVMDSRVVSVAVTSAIGTDDGASYVYFRAGALLWRIPVDE